MYRSLMSFYFITHFGILTSLLFVSRLYAQDQMPASDSEWQSSRQILEQAPPQGPDRTLGFLKPIQEVFVRTFSNLDHAKEVARIQKEQTALLAAQSKAVLVPTSMMRTDENEAAVHKSLSKTLKNFAQKESKFDIIPASFRTGLSFNIGGSSSKPSTSGALPTGIPRYRLIVTNIEPDRSSPKLATISSNDFELLPYAGKAHLHYAIGPVYEDEGVPLYQEIGGGRAPPATLWQTVSDSSIFRFRGRIAPRGFTSAGKLTPIQDLTLQQADGYYSFEAEMQTSLTPTAATHRLRVPLFARARYGEDWNQDFKKVKTIFENIYSKGPFSVNLERFNLDKRYQTGLLYRKSATSLEIYTFIPDSALEDKFWPQHRWELKLETSF